MLQRSSLKEKARMCLVWFFIPQRRSPCVFPTSQVPLVYSGVDSGTDGEETMLMLHQCHSSDAPETRHCRAQGCIASPLPVQFCTALLCAPCPPAQHMDGLPSGERRAVVFPKRSLTFACPDYRNKFIMSSVINFSEMPITCSCRWFSRPVCNW